jgi:hypothetical protein
MFKAYEISIGKWFNTEKGALSTVIYHAVHNLFISEYIVKYGNEMRFASLESAGIIDYDAKRRKKQRGNTPADMVSLDGLQPTGDDRVIQLPQLSTSEDTIYQNVLSDCFVIPVLGKIYKEASSKLQREMITWFLQQPEKLHLKSPKFRRAAKEFRMLTKEFDLTYTDCEHMIHSPKCMNRLSHEFRGLPHDFDNPTPLFNKEL